MTVQKADLDFANLPFAYMKQGRSPAAGRGMGTQDPVRKDRNGATTNITRITRLQWEACVIRWPGKCYQAAEFFVLRPISGMPGA